MRPGVRSGGGLARPPALAQTMPTALAAAIVPGSRMNAGADIATFFAILLAVVFARAAYRLLRESLAGSWGRRG